MMKEWDSLSRTEQEIIKDIHRNGPDCAKFLSRRHGEELRAVMDILAGLKAKGWLERVKGTFLFKRGFKKPKHMNHTYYKLTRNGARTLREL